VNTRSAKASNLRKTLLFLKRFFEGKTRHFQRGSFTKKINNTIKKTGILQVVLEAEKSGENGK